MILLLLMLLLLRIEADQLDQRGNKNIQGTTSTSKNSAETKSEGETFTTFTVEDLPSDGHLNFHHQNGPEDKIPASIDCICRQHHSATSSNIQSTTSSSTNKSSGARIFYLILVHSEQLIRDAVHLFRALRDPRHIIVFHVDKKVQVAIEERSNGTNWEALQDALEELQQEVSTCPCGSRVQIESVHQVEWSHWSMNLPTLWGMELAVSEKYAHLWDIFINLSGDTLPVYTPNTMANLFAHLDYNFVTSRSCETGLVPTNVFLFPKAWHKRVHYTNHEKEGRPLIRYSDSITGQLREMHVEAHFGSQWVALKSDFVQYLVMELKRPDSFPSRYRDYLRKAGKVMTDETFLPTVLMHVTPFNTTLPQIDEETGAAIYTRMDHIKNNNAHDSFPKIRALRYERMDEHFPAPLTGYYPKHPRYEVPEGSGVTPPRVWGPYYLGIYDLADIKESGALFLRKASTRIDPNLYHLLPVDTPGQIPNIQWPEFGVKASQVPDWKAEQRELLRKAAKKAKEKGEKMPEWVQKELGEEMVDEPSNSGSHEVGGKEGEGNKRNSRRELVAEESLGKAAS